MQQQDIPEMVRRFQRQLEWDLAAGFEERPPAADARYAAAVVRLSADQAILAIGHDDEDGGQFVLDVLRNDVNLAAAFAVKERYGVSPARYGVFEPEDIGASLAEAVVRAINLLQQPPPPLPHYCKSWRHMLVHRRICELREIEYKAASAIWKDGVMVREPLFDGDVVEGLINEAIACFEDADDLDAAEERCEAAERAMVETRQ